MTKGILYVAFGDKAIEQLKVSVSTVRSKAKGVQVAVVSDKVTGVADIDIIKKDADAGARTWKTQMYSLSPFQDTLFLDADTEMLASPAAGFGMLQWVDMVLAQDVNRVFADNKWPHLVKEEVLATTMEIGSAHHMYFNSGVVFFRKNSRVEAMMTAWHEEWKRWGKHDQMALLRAIHKFPVRIAPMRAPWNTHVRSIASFIYHKHHRARREGAPR